MDDLSAIKEAISAMKVSIDHIEHDIDKISKAIYGNGNLGLLQQIEVNKNEVEHIKQHLTDVDAKAASRDNKLIGLFSIITVVITTVITLIVRVAFHI